MGNMICPGQDTRFWRPGDIFEVACGNCGHEIEFFKDEARRRCPKCGTRVVNPKMSLGCAQWCEHAKECLGYDPKELMDENENEVSLTDQLIERMKKVFGDDRKRITHALAVLEQAQKILRQEMASGSNSIDPKVVMAAAILHDIGIREAEKKHGSAAGVHQEMEGPAVAEPMMKELGLDDDTIEHVLKIIANHHSARNMDTTEFRVIWDADRLVNLPEEYPNLSKQHLAKKIDKIFKTDAGKKAAYEMYSEAKAS
jgi:HD superfamily phosphohydrolase YqeK/ribosomal protein S27E